MEVRRLRPNEGAAKAIVDVVSRVKHLETRPSGTIYIDESLVARNPETGEEIMFGQLPDGSWGIDEYVNDTTPPGKPSTPTVTPVMGGLEIWWDGKESGGTNQPKDYLATECEYMEEGGGTWQIGGTFRDANGIILTNLVVGTKYFVRLISYDQNKNASEPSTTVSGVPVTFVDNEDVENALSDLREADRVNEVRSKEAQDAARAAEEKANQSEREALRAIGIADGKGRVIYSDYAPLLAADRNENNLWIDTSGTPPKNTPNRWNVSENKWVVVTDKKVDDAAEAAGRAEAVANAAAATAAAAARAAGEAQESANGKNRVWYLPSPPEGSGHQVGDTWFDTSNGNMIHRWTGTEWVGAQDAFIAKADKKAADAAAAAAAAGTTATNAATAAENAAKAAGAKGKVIIQSATPDAADRLAQNLWIDTTGGANTPKRWNGQAWVAVTDKKATDAADAAVAAKGRADEAFNLATTAAETAGDAQKSADGKNRVWYSATAPTGTGHRIGDTWFDASMDNMPKVWDGSAWISVQDKSIAKADKKAADAATAATAAGTSATNAQTAADNAAKAAGAKGKVIIQSAAPDAADRLPQNLWIDTTGGTNTPKRWVSGTTWAAVTDKVAQDAANAAVAAQSKANEAFLLAGSAAEAAGLAQESADGKNKVWYSATKPSGTLHRLNDLWFDEANGNRPMRWNGSDWVSTQDQIFKEIEQNVEKVTQSANGKNSIYYSGTAPVSTTAKPLVVGDTWFDTANGNRVKVWSGSPTKWNDAVDALLTQTAASVTEARRVADGKNSIYYETSAPTSTTTRPLIKGDTWFNTSKNYQMSTWTGGAWQLTQDSSAALSAANGKNKVSTGASAPASPIAGDMWIDTANNNQIKVFGTGGWTNYVTPGIITADIGVLGSAVVGSANITDLAVTTAKIANLAVTDAKISTLNAGKINAGELDAARIGAKTISVDKLLVSSTDNLVQDADFSDPTGAAWNASYSSSTFNWEATGGRNNAPALRIVAATNQQGTYNVSYSTVTEKASYRVAAWVKASVAVPLKGIGIYARQKYVAGGTNLAAISVTNEEVIPANTWYPITGMLKMRDDATAASFGIFINAPMSSGNVWVDYLSATRASDGELIVDGAITSKSITTDGIDAGVIKFGSMDGGLIKADTIRSASLAVTDLTNFAPGLAGNGVAEWSLSAGMEIIASTSTEDGKRFNASAPTGTALALGPMKEVKTGDRLYASASMYRSGVMSAFLRWYFYNKDRTYISYVGSAEAAATATSFTSTALVPANAAFARIQLQLTGAGNGGFFDVRGYKQAPSTLIENGAITTDHMTVGTIDAKVIKFNTITGSMIQAKTISTDNLLITSTDNLVQEADFGAKGIGWDDLTTTAILPTGGRNGGPALRFTAASGIQTVYNKYTAAVEPGNVYRLTADIKPSFAIAKGGTTFVLMAVSSTGAGAKVYHKVYAREAIAANTWGKLSGMVTIPETAATMRFALELPAAVTAGTVDVDFVSVARASDGELIVDGSITTNSMKAGTIDGNRISANSISGTEIMAKTITVDNMLISSTDNFIHEADFSNKGTGWSIAATWANIVATAGRNGGPALVFTNASGAQSVYNLPYETPMEGGQNIRVSAWVKTSVAAAAGTIRIGARTKGPTGANTLGNGLRFDWPNAIAANTWTRVYGMIKLPTDTVTASFYIESNVSTGTTTWDYVSATRAAGAELIVDGSITSQSIVSEGIDAGVITAGTMSGARISAGTLSAETLIIGQGTNLLVDPNFQNDVINVARASRSTGTWTYAVDSATKLMTARTVTATTNNAYYFGVHSRSAANAAKFIPVLPGERYLLDAKTYTNISAAVRWNVETIAADGTTSYSGLDASRTTGTGWRNTEPYEYVVPAGVVAVQFALACLTTGATWLIDSGAMVARKTDGNLIVDGALTGKTITGALIETVATASRGIKMNATEFVAYNNSGVETLRLSGNVATITGATVQTATTGARVVMDKTGLRAYGANNAAYLTANSSGLTLTGELTALTTSNTEIPAGVTMRSILGNHTTSNGINIVQSSVPGLAWTAGHLDSTTRSPASVTSTTGDDVVITARSDSRYQTTPARVVVGGESSDRTIFWGDVRVDGTLTTNGRAANHAEWSRTGVSVPFATNVGPRIPTLDTPNSSPVWSQTNGLSEPYAFAKWSANDTLSFTGQGPYIVDVKAAITNGAVADNAWLVIEEDGFPAQISYLPAGESTVSVSGTFYWGAASGSQSVKIYFRHGKSTAVLVNWRVKVTRVA